MDNSEKRDSIDPRNSDAFDREDGDVNSEVGVDSAGDGSEEERGNEIGLTERLTDLFVGGGDGDLVVGRKDGGATVMQWLQALDLQVMGACRADERLKPMLKSGAAADDRLLAHLSQYFEPSEVGLLAMCLCMPLVSMRVGKVLKQGSLLLPTTDRGDLNLVLLPTSDMRLSFVGDDGQTEILFTLSCNSDCSNVEIEEIAADSSERSFLVKCLDSDVYYFWCSEKSRLLGIELLAKMKDLFKRKPSLAELTGISDSRLDYFATHLRAYFSGSTSSKSQSTSRNTTNQCLKSSEHSGFGPAYFNSLMSKPLRHRVNGNQAMKSSSPCPGSLSPRSNMFKEGMNRNLSSLKNVVREKLRRRVGDSTLSVLDSFVIDSAVASRNFTDQWSQGNHSEVSGSSELSTQSLIESLERVPPSFCTLTAHPNSKSTFCSPAYCWCPIGSTFQVTTSSLQLPFAITDLQTLPPLSSLLQGARTSSLPSPSTSILHLSSPSLMEFPSYLPDPMTRLPFSLPSSYQISTFTPLICDPIVHIPVIDICSSGQGYLVSAASGTTLPPLHSTFMNQMLPQENVVENGARETLRRLMGNSDQTSTPWIDMFSKGDDDKLGMLVGGSRGLYSGTCGVDMIANSIAALGMISLSERSVEGDSYNSRTMHGNCELETGNMDDHLGQTNPNSMDERQE